MYGQTAFVGQSVNTQTWINGRYAGATPAVVVSINGDGRTQGTMDVRRSNGVVETVSAMTVSPEPSRKNSRVRKGH